MATENPDAPTRIAEPTTPTRRAGPTRTARLGLVIMSLGPLLAAVGDLTVLVFAAPMIVVPAIGAFLVSRYGRWAHALSAVIGALGLLVAVPGMWIFTEAPDSFFDVVPTLGFLVGGLVALIGGVAGTFGARTAELRPVRLAGIGLIGLGAVLSAGLAVVTSSDLDPAELERAVELRVDEQGFTPEELALPPGETVTLAVHNDGRVAHTFTSDALDVDLVLSPGEVALAEVVVPADVAGLQYWCVPHSQVDDDGRREWMVGDIVATG